MVDTPEEATRKSALVATGVGSLAIALGSQVPGAGTMPTFALSVWVGSQSVKGVAHALHSPLMSITNAISGMTIIGGMLQLGGSVVPTNMPQVLALGAVSLSAVNLAGGFIVTNKMLAMFRRPTDPPEYWHYFLAPPALFCSTFAVMNMFKSPEQMAGMANMMALVSGLSCVGGIAAMSSQETSRMGPYFAMGGVATGATTALFAMHAPMPVYIQLLAGAGAGAYAGQKIAAQISPTSLPQAVAGFHSLVGLAACATACGDFMVHDMSHMDGFHRASIYMGAWMGMITATGSVIAYAKLAEKMSSAPLALPGRDVMNAGMAVGSVAGLLGFMATKDPATATTSLGAGVVFSGALGFHMTASIGGADMPVVITLLNSYSGWALCAEGFILDQPMLTIVGALIGSSGAFLTKIMCDGMNRSLANVILGGFGTTAGEVTVIEGRTHRDHYCGHRCCAEGRQLRRDCARLRVGCGTGAVRHCRDGAAVACGGQGR